MIIQHNTPHKKERALTNREASIAAGFQWGGSTFQIDQRSQGLITGRATKIMARGSANVPDFFWRTLDNQAHFFNATDFLEFAIAAEEYVESLYIQSWADSE